jgi:type IV pilus assembly protein PilM
VKQVGVDIGTTAVRVVELNGMDVRGNAIISKVGFAPLREGALAAGKVRNHVAVARALAIALKQAGVPPYGFIAGYSAADVAVTRMQLPAALEGDERVRTLRTMEKQVSSALPLDQSVVSMNEIRKFASGNGAQMAAVVVAQASRDEVESWRKVFRLAKCQPRALDLVGAADMRALVRVGPDGQEVHTVVDIGATKTSVATRQGTHLRSIRQIAVGGAAFTRAIMQVTGDSHEMAEARQKVISLTAQREVSVEESAGYGSTVASAVSKPKETLLDEAINAVADDLIEQIAASIENDASAYGNTLTQAVVLCGASAQIGGLRNRLAGRLGVPVQLGRPWAVLERNRANILLLREGKEDPRMMMELTTAVGLALWKEQK